jgi:hypothetical protein
VADEGVTCDVCHSIAAVDPGSGITLALTDEKRGPLCDARKTEAHRAGCSPLHAQSQLCGGCHLYTRGTLPIYTEFAEWRDGPFPALGISCQDCHMPGATAEAAAGAGPRDDVPHHGFFGAGEPMLRRALTVRAWLSDEKGALKVVVALNNEGAGHAVPTGLPERRIVVTVRALDAAGREIERRERVLGRVLVDAAGNEAPSFRAVRVASDDRIAAKATKMFDFSLPGGAEGEVRGVVVRRPIAKAVAAALGVTPPPDEPMVGARMRYGARLPGGGRTGLPATVFAGSED